MKFNIQLFAHKKGQGSTTNGRDSESKRLGAKAADGETEYVQEICKDLDNAYPIENNEKVIFLTFFSLSPPPHKITTQSRPNPKLYKKIQQSQPAQTALTQRFAKERKNPQKFISKK